uniref:TIR domain-containing adapter molecule 1 n=1 Tax=Ursus maritimus TaxID=29073 RepID=A0A452TTU4_URSMA
MACADLSLSSAFDILGAAGEGKLLHLKHKLKTLRPGCRGADLLHAMVLLKLGQETEARISLEALKADAVARLVARQWAGMDSAEVPEEPPDLSWAVARVYHLLAEEKLCPATMRDMAYQAALHTFSSRDDHRLAELQGEAQDRCGWGIIGDPESFQPLHSDLGCLPPSSVSPSGTRSLPQPIEHLSGWSRGRSLRSTGSPASLASNLEISQSPTMPFLRTSPRPVWCPSLPPRTVSPSSGETASPPSGETASPPLEETASPSLTELVPDASSAGQPDPPRALEISTHYPVECTDALAAPKSLSLPSRNTWPDKGQSPLPLPVEDTASQVASASPPPPSPPRTAPPRPSPATLPSTGLASSSLCPPSPELESEQKFYNFVILHVAADEHIALRVRERLEALGVPDGATFCEDFQVPGRGELHCLQDAIDHSAFTILLLTPNFDCRLGLHQASQSLMNSLTRPGRQDCVIPFLPLESSQAPLSPHTTSLLTGLVWLDERSQIFARRVANTFKAQRLRARKANWKKEQDVRALQEQRRHLEDLVQMSSRCQGPETAVHCPVSPSARVSGAIWPAHQRAPVSTSSARSPPGLPPPWGTSPSPPRGPRGPARPALPSSPSLPRHLVCMSHMGLNTPDGLFPLLGMPFLQMPT